MKTTDDTKKYCLNCGEDEDFVYIRTTASGSIGKTTEWYKCNNCGEELSFIQDNQESEMEFILTEA